MLRNTASQITEYWKRTWKESKLFFWFEAVGTVTTVAASFQLAFLTPTPPLLNIFILYLISSVLLQITMYMRGMTWMFIMMTWYTAMNIVGIYNTF